MALRQARFLSYGSDDNCAEIKKFLEDAGVIVDYRDIEKKPLTESELWSMVGHLEASHFLNPASDSFEKYQLAENIPSRDKLIKMLAEDHTLLKKPIIRTARLLTVGCDKQKITEMFRLNGEMNGRDPGNSHRDRPPQSGRSDSKRTNQSS
ncbi:MAG TPA: ArsC/Spx/MgsR family protein [candidate division Zixibacteria bacterium]|nr:ArsC/Spx/MgsR family protein [candidate division Zixibacteria bacterium]